jgi:transmembrane sensor
VWNRIERGVWSHLDAPGRAQPALAAPRRWWLAAAPLAIAAAIIVAVIAPRWTTPQLDGEPSRVVSGTAPAAVSLGDVHIELDAETALSTAHESAHAIVVLEHGGAWFSVAPRGRRPAFVVRAGDATIRVIGTRFHVSRAGEHSAVIVEHGKVEARFRGTTAEIGAGQRWSSGAPDRIESLAAAPPAAAPTPPEAAPTTPAAPAPAPDASGSAGVRTADRTSPARKPASKSLSGINAQAAPSTQLPPTTQAPRATQALVDRDHAEYDRLAALEPTSPEAALTGYLALARRASLWADPALFAAARLAADRRDHRARALLELYLTRFPGGANALDARQLVARLPATAP